MNNPTYPFRFNAVLWLAVGVGLACVAACSSADEAPGGGRVEHPVEPRMPLSASVASTPPISSSGAMAPPSAASLAAPPPARQRTPSEVYEQSTGIQLSPADKTIMDDCPGYSLSKNVPKRACTKDEQCGDGFCDRGHCAAIWTCTVEYGQRCEDDQKCGVHYLCLEGRCRSCVTDAECKPYPTNIDPKCVPDPFYVPSSRQCRGWVPSILGSSAPGPLPKPPSK